MGGKGCTGIGCQPDLVNLGLLKSLGLGTAILEPDLHLSFRQFQILGEFGALRDGEVLLLLELVLQGKELLRGERGPRFSVGLVLSQVATQWQPGMVPHAVIEGRRRRRHCCWTAVAQKWMVYA